MTTSTFDPRLTTYFGDATLQAGFLPLPHLFLRHYADLGLSGQQAMFAMQIMAVSWDLGKPPTTLSDIAARMGIARRTAQGIGAELAAQGLIAIYDQYDESGAQTENAYDLRPLFARLATFAPASTPPGKERQQRKRMLAPPPGEDAPPLSGTATATCPPADHRIPSWQTIASPPGRPSHPPLDPAIQSPQQESARLLTETKNLPKTPRRTQEQQRAAAGAARQMDGIGREQQQQTGHSQRWDLPLSADEVRKSRQLLALVGLNADVAEAAAPVLHPAEVWALWLHARSARLGPAWIAGQIYDRRLRRPRLAGIPAQLEAPGRLLDGLPLKSALTVLDITDTLAPDGREAAHAALAAEPHCLPSVEVETTFAATWEAMTVARQGGVHTQTARPPTAPQALPGPGTEDPRWPAAKAALSAALSAAEYSSWIAPLDLLHVEAGLVVIAAPNCFVRSELQSTHASALQGAVEAAWGTAMAVEIVIDVLVPT